MSYTMSYSNNESNFEMPHVEFTGLCRKAVLYRFPSTKGDGSKDMYGIIFYVKAVKPCKKYPYGKSIKINYPMNSGEAATMDFQDMVEATMGDKETNTISPADNIVVEHLTGAGLKFYIRQLKKDGKHEDEYYVNERYGYDVMDEPVLMDDLPEVFVKDVSNPNDTFKSKGFGFETIELTHV